MHIFDVLPDMVFESTLGEPDRSRLYKLAVEG